MPGYKGTVVHDFWKTYFNDKYPSTHALCGVHKARMGFEDAVPIKRRIKREEKVPGIEYSGFLRDYSGLEARYDEILSQGAREWLPPLGSDEQVKRDEKPKIKRPIWQRDSSFTKPYPSVS
ncbi:hypothetical protein [Neobacillus terrae]|uniref:hypothetical protein n=1 Tax=Neobacillus terrae TaxID=3034837 RepID=UPI00140CAF8F|nr:hypothetical protein [Neobacillus terrae]NHM31375.1 hypothetical protein [Neobacillus terrae]